jgi:hypothetical protein
MIGSTEVAVSRSMWSPAVLSFHGRNRFYLSRSPLEPRMMSLLLTLGTRPRGKHTPSLGRGVIEHLALYYPCDKPSE